MKLFFSLYVWLGILAAVSSQYNIKWSSDERNNINMKYYSQPGVRLYRKKSKIDHHTGSGNEDQCLRNCTSMVNCIALNVIKKDAQSLHCEFFRSSTGNFKQKSNSVFYSRDEPQCYGYCEELSYLKLCAKCQCKSLCHSKLPHYCDCTIENVNTITDCSQAIKMGNYPLTALYKVDTGSHTMHLMCQLFRFNVVEDLWITIFRRLHNETEEFKRTRGEYLNGFNKPYQDNYFTGFKAIADLTKTKSWTLGVALINLFGEEEYIEYDGFKLIEKTSKEIYYETHFDKRRCRTCSHAISRDVTVPYSGSPACPEYEIFQSCNGDTNIVGHRNYIATTLVLRPTTSPSPPEPDHTYVTPTHVFYVKGEKTTCVSLQFRVDFTGRFKARIVKIFATGVKSLTLMYYYSYFHVYFGSGVRTNTVEIPRQFWNTIEMYIFMNSHYGWYIHLYLNEKLISRGPLPGAYDLSKQKIRILTGYGMYDDYSPFYARDFYINKQKIL